MQERDLLTLNLVYLTAARELLAAGERRRARVLLGLSEPFADWVERASLESLLALARSGLLCFQPRMTERVLREATRGADDAALLRYHAALASVLPGRRDDGSH
jgi:hypothetical protein